MGYEGNCKANAQVTGTQRVCIEWGNVEAIWRTDASFAGIDTEANALLGATWNTQIQAQEVYPIRVVNQMNVNDAETSNEELANGKKEVNRGDIDRDYLFFSNPYVQKQLLSHNGLPSAIYEVDENGGIRGIEGDSGEFLPIPVQLFQVQKAMPNNGQDSAFKTTIKVVISDVATYEERVAIIEAENLDFNAKTLSGLEPVQLSVIGTPSATELVVRAAISGTSTPILGFSETIGEDWTVKNAGVEIAPNSITDNGDGTYTFDFTALVSGSTVNLLDPSVMTTQGFKSNEAQTITFS